MINIKCDSFVAVFGQHLLYIKPFFYVLDPPPRWLVHNSLPYVIVLVLGFSSALVGLWPVLVHGTALIEF